MKYFFPFILFLSFDAYSIDDLRLASSSGDSPWNKEKILEGLWVLDGDKISDWANTHLKIRKSAEWKLNSSIEQEEFLAISQDYICSGWFEGKDRHGVTGLRISYNVVAKNIDGYVITIGEYNDLVHMLKYESPTSFYSIELGVFEFGVTGARKYFKKLSGYTSVTRSNEQCEIRKTPEQN